jgi:hypothetical protein
MRHRIIWLLAALPALAFAQEAEHGEASAKGWEEIPGTKLRPVLRTGTERNPANVVIAWSGGTYDTKRRRILVWGGGHSDYDGNEVYAFDVATKKWSRLTDPSEEPISRHTYDYLTYSPTTDELVSGGGGALWPLAAGEKTTWTLDLAKLRWSKAQDCDAAGIGSTSAVGPDGRIWQCKGDTGAVAAVYAPKTGVWETFRGPGWVGAQRTGEIDPKLGKFVLVGKLTEAGTEGNTIVCDMEARSWSVLATTGAREIEATIAPGLAYHPPSGRIVAWQGGPDLYALDVAKAVWTKVAGGGLSPKPERRGTYGRFVYDAKLDAFLVVNSVDENVAIWRFGS